jgi:hypothetical protein
VAGGPGWRNGTYPLVVASQFSAVSLSKNCGVESHSDRVCMCRVHWEYFIGGGPRSVVITVVADLPGVRVAY